MGNCYADGQEVSSRELVYTVCYETFLHSFIMDGNLGENMIMFDVLLNHTLSTLKISTPDFSDVSMYNHFTSAFAVTPSNDAVFTKIK